MKKGLFSGLLVLMIFQGCKTENDIPDVSGIKVDLVTQRFEKDFFSIDTVSPGPSLQQLDTKYPVFARQFMEQILGLPLDISNQDAISGIRKFIHDYGPVMKAVSELDGSFGNQEKEIRHGLQFLKYYFPEYKAPGRLISFVGPLDAYFQATTGGYGDIITENALAVGLQLHLGGQSEFYTNQLGRQLYPDYISRRFEPACISVNCMKNIIDDLYPDQSAGKALVDQMIDKGKRLYILDKLLPYTADSLKLGYTTAQLNGCFANEGLIWNFFVENNLLFEADPLKIRNYISDGPKTDELGEGSPGFIGLFTGRQIVRAYMNKYPQTTLGELLNLEPRKLFNDAKYKPR